MIKQMLKNIIPAPLKKRIVDFRDNRAFKKLRQDMELSRRHLDFRMDTNYHCNLKCIYCYRLDDSERPVFMDIEKFKYVADLFFPISNSVALSCAHEPALTKNFAEYIKIASGYQIPFLEYVTNGVLLSEAVIDASVGVCDRVTFSIDAATKELYESIRINGDFEKVIHNLKLFKEKKKKVGTSKPEIAVTYTVFDGNVDEAEQFIEIYHDYVDRFYFSHVLTKIRNESFKGQRVSQEIFNKTADRLRMLCDQFGIVFVSSFNESSNIYMHGNCGNAIKYRLLASNGDLFMCNKEKIFNVFEKNYLSEINNSKMFMDLINRKHPYCQNCGE